MRASVTAILVIRQGGEQLSESLTALTRQSRPLSKLVLVDSSADSTLGPLIDSALDGCSFEWTTSAVPYSASFAEAIDEGMRTAFDEESSIPDSEWVWLLRDDSVASENALERLATVVDSAPLVKIAGPKQRMMGAPGVIREMGETMTRFGERIALAERERDQAQYDRLSDVLAVGEVGMLVQATTLRDLEGFDPGLSAFDGGLDLCVRARLAGHRVVVVPKSVVHVGLGPADWSARKRISGLREDFLIRRAWLYRRLVYAPPWLLPVLLVWVLPWSVARAGGQLFLKRPDRVVSELLAALGALAQIASILRARQVLASQTVTTWSTIDSLRMDPIDVRKKKSFAKEAALASQEERALRSPRPPVFPSLPWLVLALGVLSGVVFGRWWGADVLQGGGLIPLVESGVRVWDSAWSLSTPDGALIPADPAATLFAALGTLTWWNPPFALVMLFLGAIPLAGIVAWWGFSQLLSKAWTTTLAAFVWALSPPMLLALADGRVGAVLALLALPWLLGTLVTAHESWQRVGQASLATIVVTACAPSLWPVVVLSVVILSLVRSLAHPVRMIVGTIPVVLAPAAVLSLPRFLSWWEGASGRWWDGWGVLFADPGHAVSFNSVPWWMALLGWPQDLPSALFEALGIEGSLVGILAFALGALLIALATLSLALGQARTSLVFGLLSGMGLVTATVAPALFSGFQGAEPVFVWPGVAVGVLLLGLLVGAGALLDRVDFYDSLGNPLKGFGPVGARLAGGGIALLALVAPSIMAVQAWSGGVSVSPVSASRTLPAFVAAEAVQSPEVGTLVISAVDGNYLVSLERGSGATLMESSTLVRGRDSTLSERDEDLARLAAMLVRPSAADPQSLFEQYGVSFVLLYDSPNSEAALTLSQRPELISASSAGSGQLWQVKEPAPTGPINEPAELRPASQWFLGLALVATILAIPTERGTRGSRRPMDDAVPSLGEDSSDDL
ncbi:MAG: glycosyltransferase [Pontimonas sp.]